MTTTIRKTRPPAKTGDPAADRAASDARDKAITKPGTPAQQAAVTAAVSSATAKRDAKHTLARRVAAAAGALDNLSAADKATISAWIHHLPTGSENGKRYWPESLPRPDRSDWR